MLFLNTFSQSGLTMEVLSQNNTLRSYLGKLQGKKISIVTAFASGTEDIVNLLIENNNSLELIVGTINSFTSPKFIDHCSKTNKDNLNFFVDFGYQNSTHWKLYLVEPNIVIIGSVNLTGIGLSMKRDTCVVIKDIDLYTTYENEVIKIKNGDSVISSRDNRKFSSKLKAYKMSHKKMQSGLTNKTQYSSITDWLEEEANQLIPLLVWDDGHSEETVEFANELLAEELDETHDTQSSTKIRIFFTTYNDMNDVPYTQGDVVLCTNYEGTNFNFYTFDKIIHRDGVNYMYSFKKENRQYHRPFKLKDIETLVKDNAASWWDEDAYELNRSDLSQAIA